MCARKGDNYRGNNIDLKKSTNNCSEYLMKQIEIVKPKVILTLGYYPIYSLSKTYNFTICKTLKDTIINYPEIKLKDFISGLNTVDKIEILPYHDMGRYKWEKFGLKYELDGVRIANDDDVNRAKKILGIS